MAAGYCYCLGIKSNDFFLKDNKKAFILWLNVPKVTAYDYYAPDVTPLRGDAARNMLAFMRTPSADSGTLAKEIFIIGHNFRFVQVKYPSEYKW